MLNDADASGFKKVYLAMGFTELRRGIDGLAQVLSDFNSTWILMIKTHCVCFVEEGVIA